ncbi:unnamed protein product [Closterium sp. Yama58-4]|nr:unnamed protein product [Closterium sp. Yama58-4]
MGAPVTVFAANFGTLKPRVFLIDGTCYASHAVVQRIARADRDQKLSFCCAQSEAAHPYLAAFGLTPSDVLLSPVYIQGFNASFSGISALLRVAWDLPLPYPLLASLLTSRRLELTPHPFPRLSSPPLSLSLCPIISAASGIGPASPLPPPRPPPPFEVPQKHSPSPPLSVPPSPSFSLFPSVPSALLGVACDLPLPCTVITSLLLSKCLRSTASSPLCLFPFPLLFLYSPLPSALLRVAWDLPLPYPLLAPLLFIPQPLLNAPFLFAWRRRHRWFGQAPRLILPPPDLISRFVDREELEDEGRRDEDKRHHEMAEGRHGLDRPPGSLD